MQNLLKLNRKIRTFIKIKKEDKLLFFEAFVICGLVRLIILFIPFNKIKNHIGTYNEESPEEINIDYYRIIKKVAWAVNKASFYTPWESKCLVQAMTAQNMLKRRKLCSTLYLGVSKNESNNIIAHAWLRCGRAFVTGGYNKSEFKEVARFGNEIYHKKLV